MATGGQLRADGSSKIEFAGLLLAICWGLAKYLFLCGQQLVAPHSHRRGRTYVT